MTKLELTIMTALLAGDRPELAVLREQARQATVRDRRYTGAGFFTHFVLPLDAPQLGDRFRLVLLDVGADLEQVKHGAGFVLFVVDGAIDCLEGYTYGDEQWPAQASIRRWYYLRHPTPESPALVETMERDLDHALRHFRGLTRG